jgi:hypothetical protein
MKPLFLRSLEVAGTFKGPMADVLTVGVVCQS